MRYTFFVGSTDYYDAHSGTAHADAFPSLQFYRDNVISQNLTGVWDDVAENTLSLSVELSDDATAQRIAYAIGRRTANDAVLVVRDRRAGDGESSFNSARQFIVSAETRTEGNRTLATLAVREFSIGDTVYTYAGIGTVTRIGSIAGFALVNGREVRWEKSHQPIDVTDLEGYSYVPDIHGAHVAYLVWADASVTAV